MKTLLNFLFILGFIQIISIENSKASLSSINQEQLDLAIDQMYTLDHQYIHIGMAEVSTISQAALKKLRNAKSNAPKMFRFYDSKTNTFYLSYDFFKNLDCLQATNTQRKALMQVSLAYAHGGHFYRSYNSALSNLFRVTWVLAPLSNTTATLRVDSAVTAYQLSAKLKGLVKKAKSSTFEKKCPIHPSITQVEKNLKLVKNLLQKYPNRPHSFFQKLRLNLEKEEKKAGVPSFVGHRTYSVVDRVKVFKNCVKKFSRKVCGNKANNLYTQEASTFSISTTILARLKSRVFRPY